jgi:hypothetical protein
VFLFTYPLREAFKADISEILQVLLWKVYLLYSELRKWAIL